MSEPENRGVGWTEERGRSRPDDNGPGPTTEGPGPAGEESGPVGEESGPVGKGSGRVSEGPGRAGEGSGRVGKEDGRTAGYSVRRTLPLRVEAVRQGRRRRTMVAFGILLVLPWVLVVAFKVGGDPGPDGPAPSLADVATASALNFALFALFVSVGFLLVVTVALFCGDTVASEAGWSSLRYLLAAPVARARLLRQKMIVAMGYAALAVLSLPAMSLVAGTVGFGWGEVELPTGGSVPVGTALGRMAIILGYALVGQLVVAALAFLLSVSTDSPLGAVGGAVGLVIVSNILDAVTALGGWRDFLPTHWMYAWMDALQPSIQWTGMAKGTAISVAYSVVLFALAFRRFQSKDVLS